MAGRKCCTIVRLQEHRLVPVEIKTWGRKMITDQQKAHFDVFGFLVIRQMFSPEEVTLITREFEAAMLEDRDGKPFDGSERQMVMDWFRGRPAVEFLTNDERIHGPIGQLLGAGYSFIENNDGNLYVGDSGWHADVGWNPHIPEGRNDPNRTDARWKNHYVPAIKVAFYLDPVGKESGALRVIPGSHREPYHDRLWSLHEAIPSGAAEASESVRRKLLEMWERDTGSPEGGERLLSDPEVNHFGVEPRDIPSFALESEPGDAVFFSYQMWHSSYGGRVGRRMFTLNYRIAQTGDGDGGP